MKWLALTVAIALAANAFAADIHVRDGDTIVLGDGTAVAVRLQGVAAPELHQAGGAEAKAYMQGLVAGGVTCELTGEHTYDREVGICFDANGDDVGALIIAAGLARDCPRYSGAATRDLETAASRALPLPRYCRRK